MAWIPYNPNPAGNAAGIDCTVRAIARVTGWDWYAVYDALCERGREAGDMPSSDAVWGGLLSDLGFVRRAAPNPCRSCCTVACFAEEHPRGVYLVCPHEHVAAVVDGDWWDTWDCGNQRVYFYWTRE